MTLEARVDEVMALHLEGMSQAQIAKQMGVSRQHINRLIQRHKDDLETAQRQVVASTLRPVVTEKAHRIDIHADSLRLIDEYIAEHGLEVEGRFERALLAERRATVRAIAEELGDLSRDNRGAGNGDTFILNVIGVSNREIG